MTTQEPPTQTPMITDDSGIPSLQWLLFFNQCFTGDAGTVWTPQLVGATITGAGVPVTSGRLYRISQYLAFFVVRIIPQSGQSISGVAGSYGISGFPLQMQGDGVCVSASGNLGAASGMCNAAQNLIYPPALTSVTAPIVIMGIVEAE